jgi:hypothetical protein
MLTTKNHLSSTSNRASLSAVSIPGIKKVVPPVELERSGLRSYGNEEIERDLRSVRRAFRRYLEANDRMAVYRYLRKVYGLVFGWKAERRSEARAGRLLEMQGSVGMMSLEPYGAVVFASSGGRVDPRHRSKWSRALRFAGRNRVPPGRLVRFLRRNGGLNVCARALRKDPRRSSRP